MRVPMIHINGSSEGELTCTFDNAVIALRAALQALDATAPNGRDYYPYGAEALREAESEHRSRVERVAGVLRELGDIREALQDQIDAREARKG